jgi:hypothetical protein
MASKTRRAAVFAIAIGMSVVDLVVLDSGGVWYLEPIFP